MLALFEHHDEGSLIAILFPFFHPLLPLSPLLGFRTHLTLFAPKPYLTTKLVQLDPSITISTISVGYVVGSVIVSVLVVVGNRRSILIIPAAMTTTASAPTYTRLECSEETRRLVLKREPARELLARRFFMFRRHDYCELGR